MFSFGDLLLRERGAFDADACGISNTSSLSRGFVKNAAAPPTLAHMASLTDSMDALTTAAPPFVCGITREMPEKPVELIDCGHLFDQDALRRWRAAGKTRCPECGGALDSRPSSVVAASLRAYRARSRRDAAVERDDVVVAKGRPLGQRLSWCRKKSTLARQTGRRQTSAAR